MSGSVLMDGGKFIVRYEMDKVEKIEMTVL